MLRDGCKLELAGTLIGASAHSLNWSGSTSAEGPHPSLLSWMEGSTKVAAPAGGASGTGMLLRLVASVLAVFRRVESSVERRARRLGGCSTVDKKPWSSIFRARLGLSIAPPPQLGLICIRLRKVLVLASAVDLRSPSVFPAGQLHGG